MRQAVGPGVYWRASGGDVVLDCVLDGHICRTGGGKRWELLENGHEGVCRGRVGHMRLGEGSRVRT